MSALSANDIVRIWELGQESHPPPARGLAILQAVLPGQAFDELAGLCLGARDAQLLQLRVQTFGAWLEAYGECPCCDERLTFGLDAASLAGQTRSPQLENELNVAGFELKFRLPNTRDLIAIAHQADAASARRQLIDACVLESKRAGDSLPVSELPAEVITQMAARMAECDPLAEIWLDLNCPACGHQWQGLFDIAEFFWAELAARAKRLLREVDALARAYGWREADILSLSAARRQAYMELIGE